MVLMVRATPINAGLVSNTPPLTRNRRWAQRCQSSEVTKLMATARTKADADSLWE
jgi:hypothetical protein